MYLPIYSYTYTYSLAMRRPGSSDTTTVKSVPSAQILISKYHMPLK